MGAPTGLDRLIAVEAQHADRVAEAHAAADAEVEAARREVAEREARLDAEAAQRERALVDRAAAARAAHEVAIDTRAAEAEAFYDDVPDTVVRDLARWVLEHLLAEEAA